jgi:hypothetical protein
MAQLDDTEEELLERLMHVDHSDAVETVPVDNLILVKDEVLPDEDA